MLFSVPTMPFSVGKSNINVKRKLPNIPGSRAVALKSQLLVSTGVLSLDSIAGGGIPVGSIVLVEEDECCVYTRLLLKYFLAEGLASEHALFVASHEVDTHQLVGELPRAVAPEGLEDTAPTGDGELHIAWRYSNISAVQSGPSITPLFGHNFDLTSSVPPDVLDKANVMYWPHVPSEDAEGETSDFDNLLSHLQSAIDADGFSVDAPPPTPPRRRNILRVGLHSLGSPLWRYSREYHPARLPSFLYRLRAILRSAYAVAFVTLPIRVILAEQGQHIIDRCEHLSDTVIHLESLANSANPSYSEYNGLVTVRKLAAINTLAAHVPEGRDWAFKLRRRKFIIEKLHLPPELRESAQREQDEISCGGSGTSKLDF